MAAEHGGSLSQHDPVLISYLVRLGVEKRGEEYLSFPQRALLDKIGIRTMVVTDPYGNFLTQGYNLRLGAIGPGWGISIFRMECGTVRGCCPKDMPNS